MKNSIFMRFILQLIILICLILFFVFESYIPIFIMAVVQTIHVIILLLINDENHKRKDTKFLSSMLKIRNALSIIFLIIPIVAYISSLIFTVIFLEWTCNNPGIDITILVVIGALICACTSFVTLVIVFWILAVVYYLIKTTVLWSFNLRNDADTFEEYFMIAAEDFHFDSKWWVYEIILKFKEKIFKKGKKEKS